MRTITHSELRNSSATILRQAEAGETMLVTNHGKTVAVIGPADNLPTEGLPVIRQGEKTGFRGLKRHKLSRPSQELLDEIRGDD